MKHLSEDTRRSIIKFERYCPARYSQMLKKDWGLIFYARQNPQSHDSNHAVITREPADWPGMLMEITGFYGSKGMTPMLYTGFAPGEREWLWPALRQAGFTLEERPDFCMQWLAQPEAGVQTGVVVREEKEVSPDLGALIRADAGGDWTVNALTSIAGGSHCHIFAGYEGGRPAAMAVLQVGKRVMRIDDVLTEPAYRGRGYATALMYRCVSLYRDRYADRPLYLWTENPAAARIYERVGFRKVDIGAPNWTAYKKRSSS